MAIRLRKKGLLDKAQFAAFIVLVIWSSIVLFLTVLGRRSKPDTYGFNLVLFSSYQGLFDEANSAVLSTALLNILLFVPIGFTLSVVFKNKHRLLIPLLISFGFSLLIETCQLLLQSGFFELDDLFHNTLGGLIGILLCLLSGMIYRTIQNKRKEVSLEPKDDR